MSKYCRASQRPSGELPQALAEEGLGLVDQHSTGLVHRPDAVLVDQRAHTLPRHVVRRDHGREVECHHLGRADHVEQRVHDVAAHGAALDQPDAGRAEAFSEDVAGIRAEAAGHHGADVVDMDEASAPGDQPAAVVNRRHQIDVGGVERRGVGAVSEEHVALADIALEAPDHRLAGFGRAGQVVQEADATHEQRAVGAVEGDHEVVALVGNRAAGDVLQRDHRLVDDAEEPMADDGEGDRVHGRPQSRSMMVLR